MYECPYCKKPGITVLRKALLSPGMPAICKSCGKPIVVTYKSWIKGALPGAVVMIGAMFFESNLLTYGLRNVQEIRPTYLPVIQKIFRDNFSNLKKLLEILKIARI